MDDSILIVIGLACMAALVFGFMPGAEEQAIQSDPQPEPDNSGANFGGVTEILSTDGFVAFTKQALGLWRPPTQYAQMIANAEAANGIPQDLLARLLWQESRYRDDIITGATRSSAGALGIAQFMPATAAEMGINPLDPVQAIQAAGQYLARMYRSAGSWSGALAAYNWGIGNVKSWQRTGLGVRGQPMPSETQKYYTEIIADWSSSSGQTLA